MSRHTTVDTIVQAVGAVTGFSRSELQSNRKHVELAQARFTVFWLAKQMTSQSLAMIGEHFGGRDHSTVHYGVERAEELRASDEQYRILTDALLGTLMGIQRAGMLRVATLVDPLATARRVLADPDREAVRVPVAEIVALCQFVAGLADAEPSLSVPLETDHEQA